MRRNLISQKTVAELERAIESTKRSKLPFLRFIQKVKGGYKVQDMFLDVFGKLLRVDKYTTRTPPEETPGIKIINDDI